MSGQHSLLAPSAAHRWIPCPGSVAFIGIDYTDPGNEAAAQGTAAHWLAEQALRLGKPCTDWLDTEREVIGDDATERWTFTFDAEFCAFVQSYVDYCNRIAEERPGASLIEHRSYLSSVLGVADTSGTADFVQMDALITGILEIVDLKFGFIRVYAEGNEQERLYALGILSAAEQDGNEFSEVRLTIHQPRREHFDQEVLTPDELRAFGRQAAEAAQTAIALINLPPNDPDVLKNMHAGEQQCEWCPAKDRCPVLAKFSLDTVFPDDNENMIENATAETIVQDTNAIAADTDDLVFHASRIPLIRMWCEAIMKKVSARTHARDMPGWKLVAGKRGNKAWSDEEEAIRLMKSFRMKSEQMYTRKVLTPTAAKKVISSNRWDKLASLVTQSDGSETAVPDTDPRTELATPELFDNLTTDPTEGLI